MNAPYNVCIMFISPVSISKAILQQINHPSREHNEHFALVYLLSDTVLHAAGNAAYLS